VSFNPEPITSFGLLFPIQRKGESEDRVSQAVYFLRINSSASTTPTMAIAAIMPIDMGMKYWSAMD
jgi:hypothetical protein